MDAAALRAAFPVLNGTAYLNAGTDGPIAAVALAAATAELERATTDGRAAAHFERLIELRAAQRAAYATALGADPADVALSTCTTEGIATALAGLELAPGDEIVTATDEHPGLYGPLTAVRDERGVTIRAVPLEAVADAVGPRTRLVACSHVSWIDGRTAPEGLRDLDVPVLLDGAQGAGAVPIDLAALGCDIYAGSGQKWMCGPDGTGMLYVAPAMRERMKVPRRSYPNLANTGDDLGATLHPDGRRFDTPSLSVEASAFAVAAAGVLAEAGWAEVHERAAGLAAGLADELVRHGRTVRSRGRSTLVAFSSDDPPAERARLAAAAVIVRDLPGRPLLRASLGAWNDATDVERLLEVLG